MSDTEHGFNADRPPLAGHNKVEEFGSLKQSLSNTVTPNGSYMSPSPQSGDNSQLANEIRRSSESARSSPPTFVNIPKLASPADTAFTALQYLPTPILVLSSSKLVILANEAMGRLLGLAQFGALQRVHDDGDVQGLSVTEVLWGQTLSQIGVDMLQDGEPIWVDWEVGTIIKVQDNATLMISRNVSIASQMRWIKVLAKVALRAEPPRRRPRPAESKRQELRRKSACMTYKRMEISRYSPGRLQNQPWYMTQLSMSFFHRTLSILGVCLRIQCQT